MNRFVVGEGDTIYVPPGVLHAIGAGVFLVELQEPEDLSILLEWKGFGLDGRLDGHLGLGFDLALDAVELQARSRGAAEALITRAATAGPALVRQSSAYFRLDRVEHAARFEAGFAVIVSLAGKSEIDTGDAPFLLSAGTTAVIPFGLGDFQVTTTGAVLIARPPEAG